MAGSRVRRRACAVALVAMACGTIAGRARGDDLDYLPSRSVVVVSISVAEAMKSQLRRELSRQQPNAEKEIDAALRDRFGVPLANIERITGGGPGPGRELIIIRTLKPISAAGLKAAHVPRPYQRDYKIEETRIGTQTVYVETYRFSFKDKDGNVERTPIEKGQAFCLVGDRLLLQGSLPALQAVLERGPKQAAVPGVQAALKQQGLGSTLTFAFDIRSLPEREQEFMKKDLARVAPELADVCGVFRTFMLRGAAGARVHLVATLTCADAASAKQTAKAADAALAALKAKTGNNVPPEFAEDMKQARALLDAVKVSVHDEQVQAEATVDTATALRLFLALNRPVQKKTTTKETETKR